MFEVLLGTRGIMQLGWATVNCRFTNEVSGGLLSKNEKEKTKIKD